MANTELTALRNELDRIDEAIIALMRQRIEVVEHVAQAKRDRDLARLAMRPAREAIIMRKLADRADEKLPAGSLIRIWRELLAVTTRMQTPYSVVVCVKQEQPWLWDLARDHFGTETPIQRADTPLQALRMVTGQTADVVVLPRPTEDDAWWHTLAGSQPDAPKVVARLPFCNHQGYPDNATAYVAARLEHEPSGDDLTLIAVEAEAELSRARLREALESAELEPNWLATVRSDPDAADHLLEIKGFVDHREPRVSNALSSLRGSIRRVVSLGGYARTLAMRDENADGG